MKLKPCPFCGEKAELYGKCGRWKNYNVGCCNGKCFMQPRTDFYGDNKEEAIEAWNKRVSE